MAESSLGYISEHGNTTMGARAPRDRARAPRDPYICALARRLDGVDVRELSIHESTYLTHDNGLRVGTAFAMLEVFGPPAALLRHGLVKRRHLKLPPCGRKCFHDDHMTVTRRKTGVNVRIGFIDEDRLLEWFGAQTFAPIWRQVAR